MAVTYKGGPDLMNLGVPLSTDLLMQLRRDILQGKFLRGQKITEQQICNEYKVSRTPVREALRGLEMEGLIETIPNRGAFVVGFSRQDMLDMLELRKAYEIQAVKWAISRITDEELDILEETFEFMEFYTQKNDIQKMLNINTNFHQLIYTASHNKMLRHMLSSYQIYMKYSKKENSYADDYLISVLEEHRQIFEAFKCRDSAKGISAMEKHMDNSIARTYF